MDLPSIMNTHWDFIWQELAQWRGETIRIGAPEPSGAVKVSKTGFSLIRGTSLIWNSADLEPYSRAMSRALGWSSKDGLFSYKRGSPVYETIRIGAPEPSGAVKVSL